MNWGSVSVGLIRKVAPVLAMSCLSGCATAMHGTSQTWIVQTDPKGAAVKTSNGYACPSTPCRFHISRTARFIVTITKPGYDTYYARVRHQTSSSGAIGVDADIMTGAATLGVGYLGLGLDAATGGSSELIPNPLIVKLVPAAAPATPAPEGKP